MQRLPSNRIVSSPLPGLRGGQLGKGVDSIVMLSAMKRELPEVAVIVVSVIPFEKTRDEFLTRGVLEYVGGGIINHQSTN
jgi:hypothetical protein